MSGDGKAGGEQGLVTEVVVAENPERVVVV